MPFIGSEWFWQTGPKRFHNDRASTATDYDWGPDFDDFIVDLRGQWPDDDRHSFPDAQVQESKPPTRSITSPSVNNSRMSSILGKRYSYYDDEMRPVKRHRSNYYKVDRRHYFPGVPYFFNESPRISKRKRQPLRRRSLHSRRRRRRRRTWRSYY